MNNSGQDIRHQLLIAKLPAMPHILIKLIDLCQNEDVGLDDLADLISIDAAITMSVLGAANNSTDSHFSHKPSLRQALLALGMDGTKSLLTSIAVAQVFDGLTHSDNDDLRGFWRHSYTAALAAKKIAAMTEYPYLEEAYLGGLLHDVGRLALLSVAPAEYSMLLSHVDDGGLCLAEQQTLQMTHAEAGAWLIERFHLDSFLADSVLYHHEPVQQLVAAHPLIRIVMLADLIASHGASEPSISAAKTLFNLDAVAMRVICSDTDEKVNEAAKLFKIDLAGTEQAMAVPYPSKRANDEGNARDNLAHEVRQMILASEARRSFFRADSESELLSAVAKSAALQFGFENRAYLLQDEVAQCLRGVALESTRQSFAEFSIHLAGGGAVAYAVAQRQIAFLDVESDLNSLVEKQLFRLLHAQHLVCLPLFVGQKIFGVVVGAVSACQLEELRSRPHSLRTFASQAAAGIEALRTRVTESGRIADEYREASRRVVHEASNPLSIIKNYLAVLDAKVKRKEPVQAEISILSQEIDHVAQILRGLTEIKIDTSSEVLGINRIVNDVVKFFLVTGFIPASIRVEMKLQEDVARVKVDSKLLKQILVNLIKNAVEAIEGEGEIVLASPSYINRDDRLYCVLTISDTGPGIPPPVLAKLFSPVRSVKSGDHAGLGLSIVHSLVQELGGIIMCRSSNTGTTFEILLPVDSEAGDDMDSHSQNLKAIEKHVGEKSYGEANYGGGTNGRD